VRSPTLVGRGDDLARHKLTDASAREARCFAHRFAVIARATRFARSTASPLPGARERCNGGRSAHQPKGLAGILRCERCGPGWVARPGTLRTSDQLLPAPAATIRRALEALDVRFHFSTSNGRLERGLSFASAIRFL